MLVLMVMIISANHRHEHEGDIVVVTLHHAAKCFSVDMPVPVHVRMAAMKSLSSLFPP